MTLQLKSCCFMSVKKGSYFSAGYTLVSNEYAPLSLSPLLQISAVSQPFIIGKRVSNFICNRSNKKTSFDAHQGYIQCTFIVVGFHYTHIFQFLCYKERKRTDQVSGVEHFIWTCPGWRCLQNPHCLRESSAICNHATSMTKGYKLIRLLKLFSPSTAFLLNGPNGRNHPHWRSMAR